MTTNPDSPTLASTLTARRLGQLLIGLCVLLAVVSTPVAAQESNPICSDDSETLANLLEGFIQITTALGVMGLLVVWQADSLLEMVAVGREQQASLRTHKRTALKSAVILICLGPLFTVAGTTMGLPIASCVDLIPF
jgi:hypothetical protein